MEVKIHLTRFTSVMQNLPKLALILVRPYNPIHEIINEKNQINQDHTGCPVIGDSKRVADRNPSRSGRQADRDRFFGLSPDWQPLSRNWRQTAAVMRPLHRHVFGLTGGTALFGQWQKTLRHTLESQDYYTGGAFCPVRGRWNKLDALLLFRSPAIVSPFKFSTPGFRPGDGNHPGQLDLASLEPDFMEKSRSKTGILKLEAIGVPVPHRNRHWGVGLARYSLFVLSDRHPLNRDDRGHSEHGLHAIMDDNTQQGVQSRKIYTRLVSIRSGRHLRNCPDRLDGPDSFSHYWILDRIPNLD